MKIALHLLALFLALAVSATKAHACDFCMLGQGVSPYMTATGKGITLNIDYRDLDHLYNQAQNIDGHGKKESWLVYSLTGFYPLNDDFTVLTTLAYVSKTNIDFDDASQSNPGTITTGIGDLTVTGRYTLFNRHSLDSTLIGGLLSGIKLPTGTTNNRDRTGQNVDRHALPGTGSWDFDLGFSGSYSVASGFQMTLDAVYRLATSGKWGERTHKFGNMLNYGTKAFYRVSKTETGTSFLPFFGVSGETTGKEMGSLNPRTGIYDSNLVNSSTGGTVLFADVGLYTLLSLSTVANFGFSKAFYHYMNFDSAFDSDPAENYKMNFSITYLF